MVVTASERGVVLAARELAKLEARRDRLKQAFADKIIALDREIEAARQALGTFVTGGREIPTPQVMTGGHPGELVGAGRLGGIVDALDR